MNKISDAMESETSAKIIKDVVAKGIYLKQIVDELAALEHEQWMYFRKGLFDKIENQFKEITGCSNPYCQSYPSDEAKWDDLRDSNCYKPYSELTEEEKEHDRKWARKVLDIIMRYS